MQRFEDYQMWAELRQFDTLYPFYPHHPDGLGKKPFYLTCGGWRPHHILARFRDTFLLASLSLPPVHRVWFFINIIALYNVVYVSILCSLWASILFYCSWRIMFNALGRSLPHTFYTGTLWSFTMTTHSPPANHFSFARSLSNYTYYISFNTNKRVCMWACRRCFTHIFIVILV